MKRTVVSLGLEDWETLMPTRVVELGGTKLEVTPLSVADVARIVGHVKRWMSQRPDRVALLQDVSLENPEVLLGLLDEDLAEVIEIVFGLRASDFLRLPVWAQLELIDAALDVNLRGLDALKNLRALAVTINKVTEKVTDRGDTGTAA